MKKIVLSLLPVLAFLSFASINAQENVFLNRDYWKANPSIDQIEKDRATPGNDLTELNSNAFDAVCYAILEKADNKTIQHLLKADGNGVNKITHDSRTYLFWAALRNNLDLMKYLVAQGARLDLKDSHGNTVMTFAANAGQANPALYDFLIQKGTDITEQKSLSGANVLHLLAPYTSDLGAFDFFLNKGLSLQDTDKNGNGLVEYAAKGGQKALIEQLLAKKISYVKDGKGSGNAMIMASQGMRGKPNSVEFFHYLEGLGISPKVTDAEGRNPLHILAYRGKDQAVFNYFLNKGVDVNEKDKEGRTAFMNAAYLNSLEMVKILAPRVFGINDWDKEGRSALAYAIQRNSPEVVNFLLEKGADAKFIDAKGNTAAYYLSLSFSPRNTEAFEAKLAMLESKGVSLKEMQHGGNTLAHLAAKENNLALLKRLEEYELALNSRNMDGNTALHLAAMSAKNEEILKYLIAQGADKTAKTEFEESVLDLAQENELLSAAGTSLDFLK